MLGKIIQGLIATSKALCYLLAAIVFAVFLTHGVGVFAVISKFITDASALARGSGIGARGGESALMWSLYIITPHIMFLIYLSAVGHFRTMATGSVISRSQHILLRGGYILLLGVFLSAVYSLALQFASF